jgi:hypothetical protein
MMKAASTSETLVNFHQITRRYNPEDSHLKSMQKFSLLQNTDKDMFSATCLFYGFRWWAGRDLI